MSFPDAAYSAKPMIAWISQKVGVAAVHCPTIPKSRRVFVGRKAPAVLIAAVVLLLSAACSTHPETGTAPPAAHPEPGVADPPAHPKFESTALSGMWTDPKTGLNLNNDMWNCPQAACGSQEIWANSSSDWGVVANMAKGNTSVLTYPAVQKRFGAGGEPAMLANARELKSTFAESMPTTSGTIGEAAYDIWLNNWNTEVMVWVDNQHQEFSTPAAGVVKLDGRKFTVYASPGTSGGYPRGPFTFVIQKNETKGTVDILGAIRWLEYNGYISASGAGINAVDFGWEICSTNGKPEIFSISHFSISAKGVNLLTGIPAVPEACG
jgi:hypothetical protein